MAWKDLKMQPSFLLRQPILALLRFCTMTFFGIRLSFSYMPNNRGAPRITHMIVSRIQSLGTVRWVLP